MYIIDYTIYKILLYTIYYTLYTRYYILYTIYYILSVTQHNANYDITRRQHTVSKSNSSSNTYVVITMITIVGIIALVSIV